MSVYLICFFVGEMVTKQPLIRSMRTVKRETLKLISGWVSRSNDPQMVRHKSQLLGRDAPRWKLWAKSDNYLFII